MPENNVNMNLIKWDRLEDALAPLSENQRYLIASLEEETNKDDNSSTLPPSKTNDSEYPTEDDNKIEKIETCRELLKLYASLETKCESSEYMVYSSYLDQLKVRKNECEHLCKHIENSLDDFTKLSRQYAIVSGKTTSLHSATEELISEQEKLNELVNEISKYLKYFKDVNFIMDKIDSGNLSVRSDTFLDITERIENNIVFMEKNNKFKEAGSYLVKYRHCQSRVISMMHHWIMNLLDDATQSILNPAEGTESLIGQDASSSSADMTMALLYGRFQQILPKMRPIVKIIEKRSYKRQEYDSLLGECHQKYLAKRGMVLIPSVQMGLESAKNKYNGDHCSHVRHACSLLLHASIDEYRLFYQFFEKKSPAVSGYLENLCTSLYDSLRPSIINIIHLETLAEICCILRIEMLEEHVHNNMEALEGFGNVCLQLLHDAQERLVYRAHLYLQSDILSYNPSPGDLAYPDKLKMMEDIAESLREEDRQARIKKISVSSLVVPSLTDGETDQLEKHIAFEPLCQKSNVSNSPADLHGMWYPTVRRTLVCLSRLYRCVDRPVFQSLSHDAITFCVQSVENAKEKIQLRATEIDALLFQIKHLLILREQIAPFQVDFTVKEYSLDFSNVKTAAFGLLEKRSRLFALSNNALLEFLLEGAPKMKEHLIDSRKHVDAKLKASCQRLIQHCTNIIIEPIVQLLDESKVKNSITTSDMVETEENKIKIEAQKVAQVVGESLRLIKFRLPSLQQSMQLYLANRETETILFRPIRNNIVATFSQLSHFIYGNYSTEEQSLIACPLPEQISIMLSSTTLAHRKSHENLKTQQRKSSDTTTTFADIVN